MSTKSILWAALLCSVSLPVAAADGDCAIENAQYRLMHSSAVSAGFRAIPKHPEWLSGIAFYIRSNTTHRTFWFLFDAGSGRYVHLISTADVTGSDWAPPPPQGGPRPLREMLYMAADDDLRFSLVIPQQGSKAPTYILLPDLPERMWYEAEPREAVPLDIFKLIRCSS